ncbi:MAG: acetylglutamate kinase, partial [Terrimesophilobacter sp.]
MMTANWIEKHSGQTVVVKFGGNAMVDAELMRSFCDDIVELMRAGIRVVVTHGGGPQISSELAARGLESEFRGGLRVTSLAAVDAVRDVLVRIGGELVESLELAGVTAVAFAGHELGLFAARKVGTVVDGEMIELGQVGEAVSVETSMITATLDAGGVPVISAIGRDLSDGELLNINADAAASSLAVALAAQWLVL